MARLRSNTNMPTGKASAAKSTPKPDVSLMNISKSAIPMANAKKANDPVMAQADNANSAVSSRKKSGPAYPNAWSNPEPGTVPIVKSSNQGRGTRRTRANQTKRPAKVIHDRAWNNN